MTEPAGAGEPEAPSRLYARDALGDRFAIDRGRLPVLIGSLLVFGMARWAWGRSPPLALAIGLWCGYSLAFVGIAAITRTAKPWKTAAMPIVLAGVAIALGALAGYAVEATLWPRAASPRSVELARYGWHAAFAVALIAVPASQSIALARRSWRAEAERARVTARLMALQAQIEPHFLFNTLATLRSLIRRDGEAAAALLDRMTDFLRAVLPDARRTTSTLGREAVIVESYLSIMQARLGGRLSYQVQIDAAQYATPLPPLLLQPVVENAIKHGIEPAEAGGAVWVAARIEPGHLVIEVRNSGEPLQAPHHDGEEHTGMANVRSRLAAVYAADSSLSLVRDADGMTLATLRLPHAAAA